MKNRRLAIMVPWDTPFMWTKPAFNLMNLDRPEGYEVRYIHGDGWCPSNRHNICVTKAWNWGANLCVFMGADHYVDEDCLVKLVHHIDDRGYDAACGWLPSRGIMGKKGVAKAFPHTAFKLKEGNILPPGQNPLIKMNWDIWDVIHYGAESQEIHVLGTGMLMFKTEWLSHIKRPWFRETLRLDDHNFGRVPIQDTHFVYRMTCEHGARLWLDTTIKAYHLDVFPIDETYSDRFDDYIDLAKDQGAYTPLGTLGTTGEEKYGRETFHKRMQQSGDGS